MSQHWYHAGENVPPSHYGPDNPGETGVRWARYTRGFRLDDTTTNRLFSGAPPLNPFTNQPFLGAVLSASRGANVTAARVGAVVEVSVADPSGAFDFRRFVVGPGSPVALALGQYSGVTVNVVRRSTADGTLMNTAPAIQWVDELPSLPDAGLLRSPITTLTAATEINIPDGAFELEILQTTAAAGPFTVRFTDYSESAGGAGIQSTEQVDVGQIVRCQGQTIEVIAGGTTGARFFLAGL